MNARLRRLYIAKLDAMVKLLLDGSVRRLAISSVPTRQERRIRNAAISFGIAVRGSAVADHDGKVRPVVYTTLEAYGTKAARTNANGCNIRDRAIRKYGPLRPARTGLALEEQNRTGPKVERLPRMVEAASRHPKVRLGCRRRAKRSCKQGLARAWLRKLWQAHHAATAEQLLRGAF